MHASQSDKELLGRFAATGGNEVFRILVDRYSGLVFHTANRMLGNHALAQDVSQRVFVGMAKKAGQVARGGAPLPSWLHRATVLEAKAMVRSEFRHNRKKEALMNAPVDPHEHADSVWSEAVSQLDEVIELLPEADRDVLMLHFVNDLTFPEIARRLGRSSAAVQKQSRRALEKLQQLLGRRGIALSIGVLTAGLTTEMTQAAPVILAPVLGTSIGKTTTSILAVKKTTVAAISATALLCGVPLARQQAEIHRLETRFTQQVSSPETATRPRSGRVSRASQISLIQMLARDLKAQESDAPRYVSAVDHVESLTNDELILLALETVASALPLDDQDTIIRQIFQPLANRAPELALDVLLHQIPEPFRSKSSCVGMLQGILSNFSWKNPHAALAWFERNLKAIRLIPSAEGWPENKHEDELRRSLAHGFILTDPPQAIEILRPVQAGVLPLYFHQFNQHRWPEVEKNLPSAVQVVRGLLPQEETGGVIAGLASPFRNIDNKGLTEYKKFDHVLHSVELTEGELQAFFLQAGWWLASTDPRSSLEDDTVHYRAWLESQDCGRTDEIVGMVLAKLARQTDRPAVYGLLLQRDELGIGDEAVGGFLEELAKPSWSKVDIQILERLVNSTDDPERFQNLVERIIARSNP